MEQTDTPTPRTDEQIWTAFHHHVMCDVVDIPFARQLERELAASKAEVERLKEQLESTQNLCLKFWSVLEEHGFELEINQ
jgi:hypothetical protein